MNKRQGKSVSPKRFREVSTPRKPLVGVDFDPAWDKKIAGGNNAR